MTAPPADPRVRAALDALARALAAELVRELRTRGVSAHPPPVAASRGGSG